MREHQWLAIKSQFGAIKTHDEKSKIALDALVYDWVILQKQKSIQFISLESARQDINYLESNNIVLTLKLNNSQAMVYTLVSVLIINFVGFSFMAWSLINMVR